VALLWKDTSAPDEALDSLASLEQRVAHAVDTLAALRAENQSLREQLDQERSAHQAGAAQLSRLEEEVRQASEHRQLTEQALETLRSEREQVKSRIEKLLTRLEALAG